MDNRAAYRLILQAEMSGYYHGNVIATNEAAKEGREYCLWPLITLRAGLW